MFIGGSLQERGQLSSETGDQTMESLQRHAGRGLRAAHTVNILLPLQDFIGYSMTFLVF